MLMSIVFSQRDSSKIPALLINISMSSKVQMTSFIASKKVDEWSLIICCFLLLFILSTRMAAHFNSLKYLPSNCEAFVTSQGIKMTRFSPNFFSNVNADWAPFELARSKSATF